MPSRSAPTPVVVFADVVCPFAYVGLTRLLEHRARLRREDVALHVRAWPLELVNGKPLDAALVGEEADELVRQVAPDLFGGFDAAQFPGTTLPALALTCAAYDAGLPTGERVAMELRRLVFEHGRDVADPEVLRAVATEHGLDLPDSIDAARAEWLLGQEMGVTGSPHFFVQGESLFCPVLDISRDAQHHLQVRVDEHAMAELLSTCFA